MTPTNLALGDDACVQTVGIIAKRMLAAIVEDRPVQIDVTGAVNCDLSIVQLIEAARGHAKAVGCDLLLVGVLPPAMRDVLDRAGVLAAATPAEIAFWHHGDNDQ